jgi:hypothetical protein
MEIRWQVRARRACFASETTKAQRTQSNSNKNAKSTKPIDVLSLITVWSQVQVLPGPPAFTPRARLIAIGPNHIE